MKIEPQAWQVFLFSSPLYEPLEDQTTITPSNQAMLKIGFYAFTMLLQFYSTLVFLISFLCRNYSGKHVSKFGVEMFNFHVSKLLAP